MTISRRGMMGFGALLGFGGAGSARATTYVPPNLYIYFEHASDALGPEALQLVSGMKPRFDDWVAASKQPARYVLTGSIDGAETASGLEALVGRRVETVRKAMVAAGIDPALISIIPRLNGEFAFFEKGEVQPLSRAVHIRLP